MNALILAAGYATRLYPLTLNKAKPLLEVGGKPIIEWLFDNLAHRSRLANDLHRDQRQIRQGFLRIGRMLSTEQSIRGMQIKIINDGSTSDDDKLGAIGDINLVLTREKSGDGRFARHRGRQSFRATAGRFCERAKDSAATVAVYDVGDLEAMKKYGTVTVDAKGVITNFEEKPEKPKSTLASIALYYYSREVLPLFTTYLAAGNNPDQPGRFLQWLYTRKPVNTFQIKGRWLDIGSKETLEEADKIFARL